VCVCVCVRLLGSGDVTFTMDDDSWLKLMSGRLSPQQVTRSRRLFDLLTCYAHFSFVSKSNDLRLVLDTCLPPQVTAVQW